MTGRAIAVIPDGSASAPVRDRLRSIQEWCESNDVDIIDIYVSELEKAPLEHIFRLAIGSVVMDDVDTIVFAHSRDLYGTGVDLYDLWDACSSAKVRIVFAEEPGFDLDAIVDKLVDRLGESIRRRFNGHVRAMGDYCYYVPPEDLEDGESPTPREDDYDAEDSEIFCDGWMRASPVEEESVEEESEDEPEDETPRLTAVIYCRVAPEDTGCTNGYQESVCREWCEAHDYDVVGVYSDIMEGDTLVRPGLSMMLNRILVSKDVDYIVAYDQSRITRGEDPKNNFDAVKRILKSARCRFRFVIEDLSPSCDGPEIDDDVTRIIRTWCISSRIMADTLAQVLDSHGIDMDAYGQDGDPDE